MRGESGNEYMTVKELVAGLSKGSDSGARVLVAAQLDGDKRLPPQFMALRDIRRVEALGGKNCGCGRCGRAVGAMVVLVPEAAAAEVVLGADAQEAERGTGGEPGRRS